MLLLAAEQDLLIPSRDEGPRLARRLPRCRLRLMPGRSHAMLQEAGVDLVALLDDEGFYTPRRQLSTWKVPQAPQAQPGRRGGSAVSSTGGGGGDQRSIASPAPSTAAAVPAVSGFGAAAPVELPTPGELEQAAEAAGLKRVRQLVSPVFFSTDAATGRVQQGLGAIPSTRPILFVGNHQTLALDMPLMVEQFLRERRMLLRGLAHPAALGGFGGQPGPAPATTSTFGNFLRTFGAVPVGGRSMYQLLEQGEAVLLYPGGVREAYKGKGEQYKLFWPEKSEFVRMAARFGATIVPFAAVGAEDGVSIVADSKELLALPVVGDAIRARLRNIPQARQGVNGVTGDEAESFLSPIVAPGAPSRLYFLFQKPIATTPALASDRQACDALYAEVKKQVEDGISLLVAKKQTDPYGSLLQRVLYEAAWGGKKQAPTCVL